MLKAILFIYLWAVAMGYLASRSDMSIRRF